MDPACRFGKRAGSWEPFWEPDRMAARNLIGLSRQVSDGRGHVSAPNLANTDQSIKRRAPPGERVCSLRCGPRPLVRTNGVCLHTAVDEFQQINRRQPYVAHIDIPCAQRNSDTLVLRI